MAEKLRHFNWGLLLVIVAIACLGFAMLYSAANGNADPWMSRQALRFAIGLCGLIAVALVDFRFWLRYAYPLYGVAFLLLIYVEIAGHIGMGAQRWIDLGLAAAAALGDDEDRARPGAGPLFPWAQPTRISASRIT